MEDQPDINPNEKPQKVWHFSAPETPAQPDQFRKGKLFKEIPLSPLPETKRRETIGSSERLELLKVVNEKIVNNVKLYEQFLRAVNAKEDRIVTELARIENLFLRYCVNLSNQEIIQITDGFKRKFRTWFSSNQILRGATPYSIQKINKGEIFPTAEGVISVIEYIRARKQILGLSPSQKYSFCVNDELDAHWQIDLIEILYTDGPSPEIEQMNLVQIKHSRPNKFEIESMIEDHRRWLAEVVLDFKKLEHFYIEDPKETKSIENFYADLGAIDEIFLDALTSPVFFSEEQFMEKLRLKNLNDKTKAWLVWKYLPELISHLDKAKEGSFIDEENRYTDIRLTLESVHKRLVDMAKIPRNMLPIKNIKSIVATGANIIKEEPLKQEGKLITYN